MAAPSRTRLNSGLLHAMRLFVAVVDARGFTAAARLSNLTPPQVSRMIAELELRLGTKLLHRNARSVTLTAAGEQYLRKCRTILELVEEAEGEARDTVVRPAGTLRVSSMTSLGRHYVQPVIVEYAQRYPGVKVEYLTRQYPPDILAEGIDSSLFFASDLTASSLVGRKVAGARALLCASPGYLAQHGTPTRPEDLLAHNCIRLTSVPARYWELTEGASTVSVPVRSVLDCDTPDAVLLAAVAGLGIGLFPSWVVIDSLRSGRLVPVLPRWRTPEVGVYLLIPSRRLLPAKTRAWIDLITSRLPFALARDEQTATQLAISQSDASPG